MLDHAKNDQGSVQADQFELHILSNVERALIRGYRKLSEQDQIQLQRVARVLASNPEGEAS